MERAGCPGVRWLRVAELPHFPYRATATTLRRMKHKPIDVGRPVACYYSVSAQTYRMLYDIRNAIPVRQQSERQKAAHEQALRSALGAHLHLVSPAGAQQGHIAASGRWSPPL
jgi:hypothetical protein